MNDPDVDRMLAFCRVVNIHLDVSDEVRLIVEGSRDVLTDSMIERLQARKLELIEAVRQEQEAEAIDPPDPCPACGQYDMWQTLAGNWRCTRCDPPTTSRRVQRLQAIRSRPLRQP